MTTMTDTYKTPEGFELAKPLLFPDAHEFGEILTALGPWSSTDHPEDIEFDGNRITPFCSTRRLPGRKDYSSLAVRPTEKLLTGLEGVLLGIDDSLAFEVIYHDRNDRCLVIVSHNQIIGSRYLAYVTPESVPAFAESSS